MKKEFLRAIAVLIMCGTINYVVGASDLSSPIDVFSEKQRSTVAKELEEKKHEEVNLLTTSIAKEESALVSYELKNDAATYVKNNKKNLWVYSGSSINKKQVIGLLLLGCCSYVAATVCPEDAILSYLKPMAKTAFINTATAAFGGLGLFGVGGIVAWLGNTCEPATKMCEKVDITCPSSKILNMELQSLTVDCVDILFKSPGTASKSYCECVKAYC